MKDSASISSFCRCNEFDDDDGDGDDNDGDGGGDDGDDNDGDGGGDGSRRGGAWRDISVTIMKTSVILMARLWCR